MILKPFSELRAGQSSPSVPAQVCKQCGREVRPERHQDGESCPYWWGLYHSEDLHQFVLSWSEKSFSLRALFIHINLTYSGQTLIIPWLHVDHQSIVQIMLSRYAQWTVIAQHHPCTLWWRFVSHWSLTSLSQIIDHLQSANLSNSFSGSVCKLCGAEDDWCGWVKSGQLDFISKARFCWLSFHHHLFLFSKL